MGVVCDSATAAAGATAPVGRLKPGYIVSAPPRVASTGIPCFVAYSVRKGFVPGWKCGTMPLARSVSWTTLQG
ncbi:MAG: hypothetical protein HYU37_05745 [Acidobacteria bacterium]|nr:hypothetical protein [Acidobacteriota bacterium]